MKRIFFIVFCWIICSNVAAQQLPEAEKTAFNAAKTDGSRGKILTMYFDVNMDKDSIFRNMVALKQYFEKEHDPVAVDYVQLALIRQLSRASEYGEALSELYELLPRFEKRRDTFGIMCCYRNTSYAYYAAGDEEKTIYYDRKTVEYSTLLGFKSDLAIAYNNIGADYAEYGSFDSSFYYAENAVRIAKELDDQQLICKTLSTLGECYIAKKDYEKALVYLRESVRISAKYSPFDLAFAYNDVAQIYLAKHQQDSAIYYAKLGANVAGAINVKSQLLRSYQYLSAAYRETGPIDSSYRYLTLTVNAKDSIFSAAKTKQVELVNVREQNRKQQAERQKQDFISRVKIYALLAGLGVFMLIGFFLYRNSSRERKAKFELQKKNELVEKTLNDLKATQTQLIQSEKMASLGELTAGIAHEIQNPLNFVNNFSEVNTEMIDEATEEMSKGNYEEVKNILSDVKENSEKINHHGKRADAIVKGMLQHSRSSSGQKEPADINALCDEYLRLSYHGLRAKDKSFNATLKTDFDESIGKINIVPQDMGRVIMNLLTNAFYAVNERRKTDDRRTTTDERPPSTDGQPATLHPQPATEPYIPTVSISTKKLNGKINIIVSDNGAGMPDSIKEKIFQPFFTTKPTGQGTGLGLSLSYDIITKGHGGELKVETTQGKGTTFTIQLPFN